MKNIFFYLLFLNLNCFSQKYIDRLYNFTTENNNIIWQKVFHTSENITSVKNYLNSSEFTSTLKYTNEILSGRTNKHNHRIVKNTPYFATWGFDAFAKIVFKENRYRVTLSEIIFDGPTLSVYGVEQKQNYPLKNNVMKNGKIKNSKRNNRVLKALDSVINSKFTIKKIETEEW